MARLTLPRMNKETAELVKMSGKLSASKAYLQSLCSNPRAADTEIVRELRVAAAMIDDAKFKLDAAVSSMATVAKTLERRKNITGS